MLLMLVVEMENLQNILRGVLIMYSALIIEKEYEDTIEGCFEEAMIYNGKGTK